MDTAVVLGGSVAGLLAARVLADHATTVVIIERDERAAEAAATGRPGVPQGRQVHILLPSGRAQLERWFPGLTREAQDRGAVLYGPDRTAAYTGPVRHVRPRNPAILASSRPFLEALIRRRTLALPNVTMVTGQATGLVYKGGAVSGVRYRTGDGEQVESAGFVADAMGRASRLPDWLEQDGWERPAQERMQTDINYATAFFKRADDQPAMAATTVRPSPRFPGMPAGMVTAIENRQWQVLLVGFGDDRPGRAPEDYTAASAQLPPTFAEAVHGGLVGEINTYRQADSRRRNFSGLRHLPARLISVGDAVASFNPLYGQGMSSAALQASCLSEYLRGHPDLGLPARQFFAWQQVVVDAAWDISTFADAARLGGPRKLPVKARLQRLARKQIVAAAVIDEKVGTKFVAVVQMTAHPASLAAPGTVVRAIAVNLRGRTANRAEPPGRLGAATVAEPGLNASAPRVTGRQGFEHSQMVRSRAATGRAASRAAQRRPWAVLVNPARWSTAIAVLRRAAMTWADDPARSRWAAVNVRRRARSGTSGSGRS